MSPMGLRGHEILLLILIVLLILFLIVIFILILISHEVFVAPGRSSQAGRHALKGLTSWTPDAAARGPGGEGRTSRCYRPAVSPRIPTCLGALGTPPSRRPAESARVASAWAVAENLCLPSSGPPTEVSTASRADSRNSWRIDRIGGWLGYAGKR